MKRLFALALALLLAFGLMACGKDVPETTGVTEPSTEVQEPETSAPTEPTTEPTEPDPTEPAFVSDYEPGEENTRSSTRPGFCIQQGGWFYYTSDGGSHSSAHAKHVLKFPIGGSEGDVQKVLTEKELSGASVCCNVCGEGISDVKSLKAVLGDWLYIEIDDGHIMRVRTDGAMPECVFCPEPEDMLLNAYVMFRDNYLYFTEETIKHLDASTLVSTFLLKKQDLNTMEVTTVGEVSWSLENFGRGSVVFQADGTFYACGEHQIVEIKTNDEVNVYDYTFAFEQSEDDLAGYRFMPGVERSLLFTSNYAVYDPEGLHSINSRELAKLPSGFVVPKAEYAPENQDDHRLWSVWDPYLLAGSEDITYYYGIIDVDDGYAYDSDFNNGLVYYSFVDQTVYKINNDSGDYLFWSEDEDLLYYQSYIDGDNYLCRVNLDGSDWEDVSWMLTAPEDESDS